ncbi:alkane 1-monooxygenase [Noviherbaspirillum autotrophicum]|uniref:Alkane 1-monooxygenase n=1 Tax=Noviherbaspirillum autotrophicum TaxID=709839 RepID=A0A0C1YR63_9BURK|nr:alkane 1-monooxygenase [Noviherbaspirillum autotrophicum]KIF83102.1 alkane 1-monooxygenase [Noviherbaspirillum autotrophicum]
METLSPPAGAAGYRDSKRYAWLLSLLMPALNGAGPLLYYLLRDPIVLWAPVVLSYVLLPVVDLALGRDRSNPPEAMVPTLEADVYYRYVTYALVPLLWGGFIFGIWFFTTHDLPWHAQLAGIIATGGIGGYGINLGHELGHKRADTERWLAKVVLAMTGYGHFYIEHNRGHHRDVATPEDPASSRMGESIYRFVLREMPGALRRAWLLEKDRLQRCGKPVWSLHNDILQPLLLTLLFFALMIAWLGWHALPFMLLASFWSNFQLTSANYIEHYGLLRRKLPNGRYEPCQPHHSWNSNQLFSNWATFHLQRHSDHHAHPVRRYQSLRHFDDVPQLPNGYFGMFVVAYLPPLWFHLMDRRLLEAVGHDPARINFDPKRRAQLMARYGLTARHASQEAS